MNTIQVCGYDVFSGSKSELIRALCAHASRSGAGLINIVTLNPEIAELGYRDSAYFRILRSADVITCDGVGVQVLAALVSGVMPERVCGSDLLLDIATIANRLRLRILLVGGSERVNMDATLSLRERFEDLAVEGWAPVVKSDGTLGEEEEAELRRLLLGVHFGIVICCLGAPKQECFLYRYRDALAEGGVSITASFGGAIDFIAGALPRAPVVLRRSGMEWVFRVLRQPTRVGRLIRNTIPYFVHALRFRTRLPHHL